MSSRGLGLVLWVVAGSALGGKVSVGQFSRPAGAGPVTLQVPHGLGVRPEALVLWTVGTTSGLQADQALAMGITDGQTQRSVATFTLRGSSVSRAARRTSASALSILHPAAAPSDLGFVGWDGDRFGVQWRGGDGRPVVVQFLALGGKGVRAQVVEATIPNSSGTVSFGPTPFPAELLLLIHPGLDSVAPLGTTLDGGALGFGVWGAANQWSGAFVELNADSSWRGSDTVAGRCLEALRVTSPGTAEDAVVAQCVSTDSGVPDLQVTNTSGTAFPVFGLAVAGLQTEVATFSKTAQSAPAVQNVATSFVPDAVLLHSNDFTESMPPQDTVPFSFGAMTASASRCVSKDSDVTAVIEAYAQALPSAICSNYGPSPFWEAQG